MVDCLDIHELGNFLRSRFLSQPPLFVNLDVGRRRDLIKSDLTALGQLVRNKKRQVYSRVVGDGA